MKITVQSPPPFFATPSFNLEDGNMSMMLSDTSPVSLGPLVTLFDSDPGVVLDSFQIEVAGDRMRILRKKGDKKETAPDSPA